MKSMLLILSSVSLLHAAENPRLEFALGTLEKLRGQPEQAARRFEKARILDPTAWPLVETGIGQRLGTHDLPGAVKLYRDLASARKKDLGVQLGYVDFLEQYRTDPSARQTILETALKQWPGDPEVVRRLFSIRIAAGEKDKALKLLETLSSSQTAAVMLYASLSRNIYPADDQAAGRRIADRFISGMAAQPGNPILARTASDYFRDQGRMDLAIRMLEQHIQALPSSLELRSRLGVLYFSANEDPAGERTLKEVLTIDPHQAMAHQALAKFYRLRKQAGPARYHAGELLKIRGGTPGEFLKLSDEFLAAGQPRDARLLLEKAVFDTPENFPLLSQLAIATRRDPSTKNQASRLFREAEAARKEGAQIEPAFLVEFAEVLVAEGQSKPAEDRLREAIRSYPADAKKETAFALRRLADLWENENRNQEAVRSLRKRADTLDLHP